MYEAKENAFGDISTYAIRERDEFSEFKNYIFAEGTAEHLSDAK